MSVLHNVCHCGDKQRIRWIAPNETGSIVAVGRHACLIDELSEIKEEAYEGDWLRAHVGGKLVCFHPDSNQPTLVLANRYIPLPSSMAKSIYDDCYIPETNTLYLLSLSELLRVSLDSGKVTSLADDLKINEHAGRYERVIGSKSFVVAFRYGLRGWRHDRMIVDVDSMTRPYSFAAILSDERLIAVEHGFTDRCSLIHLFDIDGHLIDEHEVPGREAINVCCIRDTPVVLAERDGNVIGVWKRDDAWNEQVLGSFELSCDAEPIPEANTLAIATLRGPIVLWHIPSGHCDFISVAIEHLITALHWSPEWKKLYIGTKYGEVYALAIDDLPCEN